MTHREGCTAVCADLRSTRTCVENDGQSLANDISLFVGLLQTFANIHFSSLRLAACGVQVQGGVASI